MLENGFIKLYRSLLKWEWYDDINTKVVFLHLLLVANFEDESWHGIPIKRGQRLTSYGKLAKETRLSERNVRTAINHLKSTGEVTQVTTPEYSLFTVVNYDRFQEVTSQLTDDRQTSDKAPTSHRQQRKKANKAKEEKEDIYMTVQHLTITKTEHDKLVLLYGLDNVTNKIEYAENYAKLKNYKSLYLTLNNWLKEDGKKGVNNTGNNKEPKSFCKDTDKYAQVGFTL